MKRGAWGLLLLLAASTLTAGESKFYLGGSFLANQPTVFWNYKMFTGGAQWLPVPISPAYGVEMGISSARTDFYLGYQEINSYVTASEIGDIHHYYWYEEDQWDERRCLLGGRYRWSRDNRNRVVPVMGGALSIGRSFWNRIHSEHDQDNPFGWGYSYKSDRRSKIGIGFMGEGGIMFFSDRPFNVLALAQVQWYERRFPTDDYKDTPERLTVLSTVYTLSVRYNLLRRTGK